MAPSDNTFHPIGFVRSPIVAEASMPLAGTPATIDILPEFAAGLQEIATNTHLIVLAWLDHARRDRLQVQGLARRAGGPPRGVFGLRSSARPNPIGLTVARLVRVDDTRLQVDRLDFVDGTPVVDIKRYSPGWDAVFSARTSRDLVFPAGRTRAEVRQDLLLEAEHFHGERCRGSALGVRMLEHAMNVWQIGAKDPRLQVTVGTVGCVADALQGCSGATLGARRLGMGTDVACVLALGPRRLRFVPIPNTDGPEEVLTAEEAGLFRIED